MEKRGVYFFDAKPVLVKGLSPHMDLHTESIKSLPIWIQLPNLDIKFWGTESLSKIGSTLGIPLKTDRYTRERRMVKYARLLIDMPLDGHFPDYIDFFNEEGIPIRQQVHYEWKPIKCTHCKMFGYEDSHCKKKGRLGLNGDLYLRIKGRELCNQHSSQKTSLYLLQMMDLPKL